MVEAITQNATEEQHTMLLSTKFSPPLMRPVLIARPHLVEYLERVVQQQSLTLISAPAGSGKSTLVSSWYTSSTKNTTPTTAVAWLSLETSDNDPVRFWTAFIIALQKDFPAFGHDTLATLRTSQAYSSEAVVRLLVQDMSLLSQPCVLILDDYHSIETQAIHQSFTFLLEHLPSHVHFIVSTRTDPPLPLARLRVRGQLAEIRAPALNFTSQDAEDFFSQVMGLHLTPSDISMLVAHTEGWVAGLQLAALSLQGRKDTRQCITAFTGGHGSLVDFLSEEILQHQPEHIQHFLLFTSLLERFTPTLCDTILGETGSYLILKQIEQANLFVIVLDDQQQWYRYHHLFAEFLRTQLCYLYPEHVASIHKKAAYWYEKHGYMTEAIIHFLASSDAELAADYIERYCDTLIKHGELSTLLSWVDALPENVVCARPRLCLYCAAALGSTNQLDAAELRVQEAERTLYKIQLQEEIAPDDLQNIMGELVTVRTSLAGFRGDIPHTIHLSQQALTQISEENVFIRGILTASLAVAYATKGDVVASYSAFVEAETLGRASHHSHLWLASIGSQAYMVMEQGRFYQAEEICRHVLQYTTPEDAQEQTTSSMAYMVMGELYYQWNMLDEAERYLQHGHELGQEWGYLNVLARGTLFRARIKDVHGDEEGARALLQLVERQALQHNLPQIATWATALQARMSLTHGDIEAAVHWSKGSGLSTHDSPKYLDEVVYLILAQILAAIGRQDEVMPLLTRMLSRAEADGRGRNVLEVLVVQAILYNKAGDTTQAYTILARALSLAEPQGNLRVFIEEGTPMRHLLVGMMQNASSLPTFSEAYVQILLAAMGYQGEEHIATRTTIQHTTTLLTEREHEILGLVAAGFSNQQIADTLVVAVNTVKWYLKQLSRKLNAHSRTQIIANAREKHVL